MVRPLALDAPAAPPAGVSEIALATEAGPIRTRLHAAVGGDAAVLWVFGSGGGLGGPAGGVYARLSERLRPHGVTGLELDYRQPGALGPCVADVLTGIVWLTELGRRRIVLVGHSFGGAVVISAGAESSDVIAVAALSSQTGGTQAVGRLSPRPVLIAHGTDDEVLPDRCSHDLYARAREPKRLILYPGCRHGLDACRDALDHDLMLWLGEVLELGRA
jgi:hypothetical protein